MVTYQTYYHSPIGMLGISGTDTYISSLTFIDDEDGALPAPNANQLLLQCVEELIEYFNGKRRVFTIPVYQQSTQFQSRVYSQLLNIRFGSTISYMDLAKRLGDPKAIRAAASSNGKNNVCIIVPCHRVVGSNQTLVGYIGGLWRKKWLLNHENKIANGVQTLFDF